MIFFENNSTEIWMSSAWFWCISNWPMCYFLLSVSRLVLFSLQLSPFSSEVAPHVPKHYSQWLTGSCPLHIAGLPSHHLKIMESPLLPVPSRSVFLGILMKTHCVDPAMTPCPVPGLWGTSQLGIKPVLAVLRILVVFETGNPRWLEETAVRDRQEELQQREKGDKSSASTLNEQQLLFSAYQIKILYLVSKTMPWSAKPGHFTDNRMASGLKYLIEKSTVPIMQISGVA